jgi:hypothetical protein
MAKTTTDYRPKYTAQLVEAIAQALERGETLRSVCASEGMPHYSSVYDWMNEKPEVAQRIARAREVGHDAIADECLEIADKAPRRTDMGSVDNGDVADKKLRIWTRMQLLAKWSPNKYGEKLDVTTGGDKLHITREVIGGG